MEGPMTTRTMPVTLLALMIALVACNGPAQQDAPAPAREPTATASPAQAASAVPASTSDLPASDPSATDVPTSDAGATVDAGPATRCGWFENPTPGNAWLNDRDGSWTIGIQGGPQADGEWPGFDDAQWIVTNGSSYGYGCACMSVTVDAAGHRILTIHDARALPLSQCRDDPALEEPPRP